MNNNNNDIKLSTIEEQVYNILRDKIMKGVLKPGEWMQENKIAEALGVSRSPVREALKELVGEGLLESKPNKGVFVRILNEKDVYNMIEYRLLVEKFAIEKSIELATDKDIERLEQIYSVLKKTYNKEDLNGYIRADTELHSTLLLISGNEIVYNSLKNVFSLLQPFRTMTLNSKKGFEVSLSEHRGIIDGIKERNFKKAWKYDSAHLKKLCDRIISYIKSSE